jgi:RND superfamily putative drug exporter
MSDIAAPSFETDIKPHSPMLKLTRWTIANRRIVILSWFVFAVGLFGISQAVGTRTAESFSLPGTNSQHALDLLKSRFPARAGDADQIVFRSRIGKLTDLSTRGVIVTLLERVGRLPHVTGVVSPYAAGARAISKTGTIGFATVEFDEPAAKLPKAAVNRVIAAADGIRSPALQVELGGQAIQQAQQTSLGTATLVGLLAAVTVLLLVFGSVLAMGLPIVTALLGLGAGVGVIGLASQVIDMPDFATELALMIGLGVGIDYALFIVTRFREVYRENGGAVKAAVELAMNTAGRATLLAGTTVVIGLLGMFALGISLLNGAAVAASLAVLLALAASVTLLPSLLMLVGRRVGRTRNRRARPQTERVGFWRRWVGLIQRHPIWAIAGSTAAMLVLAAPALGLWLGSSDAGNDPASQTTRRAYDLLATGFGPGFNGPLLVTVRLSSPGKTAVLTRFTSALRHANGVASVAAPQLSPARGAAVITVYPTTSPESSKTSTLVKRLRNHVLPPVASETDTTVFVGGVTASQVDFAHVLGSKLPLFIGVVMVLSALLLLIVFRSLLIPIQAVVMNLLTIGAALGVVQAIFERGWLGGALGVQKGPVDAWIPVMVFAVVFGLSMDYEVFLVSRIHEEWERRHDPSAAIREGVAHTGRVITAAAAVMIAVFISFALGDERVIKLLGTAMAVAIFLDAFVIRSILLPAVLQVAGPLTWRFPNWFDRRLPRLAIELPTHPGAPIEEQMQPLPVAVDRR